MPGLGYRPDVDFRRGSCFFPGRERGRRVSLSRVHRQRKLGFISKRQALLLYFVIFTYRRASVLVSLLERHCLPVQVMDNLM